MENYNKWLESQLKIYKSLFMRDLTYNGKTYYIIGIKQKISHNDSIKEDESGWFYQSNVSLYFELIADFDDVIELPCLRVYEYIKKER